MTEYGRNGNLIARIESRTKREQRTSLPGARWRSPTLCRDSTSSSGGALQCPMRVRCHDCGTQFEKVTRGHLNRCPPCRRAWEKAWRARRKAAGKPVISTKMSRQWHREYEAIWKERPGKREKLAEHQRRYRMDDKLRERHKARWIANRAKAAGILIPQPCEVCGAIRTDAHHDDYTKPLTVRWLCRQCHANHHKAQGE